MPNDGLAITHQLEPRANGQSCTQWTAYNKMILLTDKLDETDGMEFNVAKKEFRKTFQQINASVFLLVTTYSNNLLKMQLNLKNNVGFTNPPTLLVEVVHFNQKDRYIIQVDALKGDACSLFVTFGSKDVQKIAVYQPTA